MKERIKLIISELDENIEAQMHEIAVINAIQSIKDRGTDNNEINKDLLFHKENLRELELLFKQKVVTLWEKVK